MFLAVATLILSAGMFLGLELAHWLSNAPVQLTHNLAIAPNRNVRGNRPF